MGFTWETNGKQAAVAFADSTRSQYWTAWGSPAIDAGCRIPGVNTTAARSRGAAPDAGRFEFPAITRQEK